MPFDFTCLHCGGKMSVNTRYGNIQCHDCGRFLDGSHPPDDTAPDDTLLADQTWRMGKIYYQGRRTRWINTLLNTLRAELAAGDRAGALETAEDLIGMDKNMIDGYFWRAKLTTDPAAQRDDLDRVLALEPQHAEARQMLMLLDGQVTQDDLDRAADLYRDNRQQAEDPVDTQVEVLLCPVCRGTLAVADNGSVTCAFCDYADEDADHAIHPDAAQSLAVALIKQRAQPVRWQVGERVFHCNACGAERTLRADRLAAQCPFCGSTNVATQDALNTFRQPDGLLKFRLRAPDAVARVQEALASPRERVKGLFGDNAVRRTDVEGVFVPYWVFDIYGTVIVHEEKREDGAVRSGNVTRTENATQLRHAPVPAVNVPPRKLLRALGRYNWNDATPYTPKLLGTFTAELYTIDFDSASLDARGLFRREMERKYPSSGNINRTVTNQIHHMEMRLLLAPVWLVTLHEADGDVRPALVNGRSGAVALGRAAQPAP